jgi:hypothetical protein
VAAVVEVVVARAAAVVAAEIVDHDSTVSAVWRNQLLR